MSKTIIYIDSRVPDYEALIRPYEEDFKIVVLDAEKDGVVQLVEALAGQSGYESIQIISHGSPGRLMLGNTLLSVENLSQYEQELGLIGDSLRGGGDLLLYGCNVGFGETGATFVGMLASMTGVDVAASDDRTGGRAAGGDWELEVTSGEIEVELSSNESNLEKYEYTLDAAPAFGEFLVNTYTDEYQNYSSVTGLSDGGFVVVWESDGQDGSSYGIYGQRYSADGFPVGEEFQVNTHTDSHQRLPSVASLSDGGFVVVWDSYLQESSGDPIYAEGIYAQRYGADGSRVGGEFHVNTVIEGSQSYPFVAGLSDGGFVVTWQSQQGNEIGLYCQIYGFDGTPINGEIEVVSNNGGFPYPSIAGLSNGGFVVIWESHTDTDPYQGYGQIYAADGLPAGDVFKFNSISEHAREVSVTGLSDGGFVIAWQSAEQFTGWDIYACTFSADGTPVSGDFVVHNDIKLGNQRTPSVTALSDGGFVVTWDSYGDGESDGIIGQRYAVDGTPVAGIFQVNSTDIGVLFPSVSGLNDGGFVVTWGSEQDGSGYGVYGQRYDVDGNPVAIILSNEAPTLTQFSSAVQTTDEDAEVEVTFADLAAAGDEADADGTVDGFVVKSVSSGTLRIGVDAASATAYDAATNNRIDAAQHAYWTPDEHANGELGAFSVVAVDDAGEESPTPVEATVSVAAVNDAPAGILTISGALLQGETLTAYASLDDPEGLGALSYQWYADGEAIVGATLESYVLTESEVGKQMTVRVSYTDGQGTEEQVTSSATSQVANTSTEFRINTYTDGDQFYPSVTTLADGGFVVTWESFGQDGDDLGIYGQRYNAAGSAIGSEFQINTYTASIQQEPSVTSLADGGFVVAWESDGQDGSGYGVYGQRYDAAGNTVGDEFRVNTYTNSTQYLTAVASLADGGFVMTWSSDGQDGARRGIYGQRYDAAGNTVGDEFRINTYTDNDQTQPEVTSLADGGFVVTWHSGDDGSSYGMFGQRYDAAGNTVGGEFQINTYTDNRQTYNSVTSLDDGGFVVTWGSLGQDGSGWGIYGQRYDATGNTVGGEFQISTYTDNDQRHPSITSLADGGFVVTWSSKDQDGSGWGIYGQRYDVNGNPVGGEFRVNTYTDNDQLKPSVTSLNDGGFVVTWGSEQDGSGYGVYGQRYDVDGNPVAIILSNEAPTLTQFSSAVQTTDEDAEVEVTFADLAAAGDEADADGTVDGFVVKSVSSGTLRIGVDAASATAYDAATNNRIDAAQHAYWTPDEHANGELGAFSVVAVDDAGEESPTPVEATVSVTAVNDAPEGSVTISGTAAQGETLTAGVSGISDPDGLGMFSYQWYADGEVIVGATLKSYVLTESEVGKQIMVEVSYIDGHETEERLMSEATHIVTDRNYGETDGNDVLFGMWGDNVIFGSGGDDFIMSFAGNDILIGGTGNDIMMGGIGDDTYYVDSVEDVVIDTFGNDTVKSSVDWELGFSFENLELIGDENIDGTGNFRNNEITGNDGDNYLRGLSGKDTLDGGAGDDILEGGRGRDLLIGGEGSDQLTGGNGRDVFKYVTVEDSGITFEARDSITDFDQGRDRIDLSELDANRELDGNQGFSSAILAAGESFTNAGQLLYDRENEILYGNVDGDLEADFAIHLVGIEMLSQNDIVF